MSNDPILRTLADANERLYATLIQVYPKAAPAGAVTIPNASDELIREALAASQEAHEALRMSLAPAWGQLPRQPVQSSNVASIGHHAISGVLEVEFKNGGVYRYHVVSTLLHQALMSAPSVGKFLNERIKPACRCEKQPEVSLA